MTAFIWRLAFAVAIMAALRLAGSIGEGWERMRRAGDVLDVYPTDDEPVPYLPTDVCTDPDCDCEQAREVARGHLRLFRAMQEQAAWEDRLRAVARADAEAAGVRDGGR
jgi:hypothetical protein